MTGTQNSTWQTTLKCMKSEAYSGIFLNQDSSVLTVFKPNRYVPVKSARIRAMLIFGAGDVWAKNTISAAKNI
jgi:hypothetical protein